MSIVARMIHNWSYRDVIDFLKENGFRFYKELGGSHQAWIKYSDEGTSYLMVEVNFTHGSYHAKTLKRMIRQSGIDQKQWIKWAGS